MEKGNLLPPSTAQKHRLSLAQVFAGNQVVGQTSRRQSAISTTTRGSPAVSMITTTPNNINKQVIEEIVQEEQLPSSQSILPDNLEKEFSGSYAQKYEIAVLAAASIENNTKTGRAGAISLIKSLDPTLNSNSNSNSSNKLSKDIQTSGLTADSDVHEFREFHDNIDHPATSLALIAEENDRQVHTEFDQLCNELLENLGDFEASLEELTLWKDDFMGQTVPSAIKLQLTLLFARLFRSKSSLHEPMFELIRQVRLYSRPWMNKQSALLELEKDYQRQGHVLDVAIRKLEQLQLQIQRLKSDKKIALWERLCHKIFAVFLDDPPADE
ncbi:hypothetical protein HK100_006615 [Physocladia obscura]|uniref:Uncharacterized protein n=1 Tax=Physocladia obscura TaxID=109957 RepID=A0AAD5SQ82_9FUNG|nr:hypothetical protein HK100_006615 [Physocladia obscura]